VRINGSPGARPIPPSEREVVEQAFVGLLRVVVAQLQGDDQIVIANGATGAKDCPSGIVVSSQIISMS